MLLQKSLQKPPQLNFPFLLFPLLSFIRKYDSLIQDQARELSYLRQKIREGRGICYLLTQHSKDTVKSFEDLLRSNDIDYYLGQSFREHLAQGSQLTERLTSKLSTSKSASWLWDPLSDSQSPAPGAHLTSTTAVNPSPASASFLGAVMRSGLVGGPHRGGSTGLERP